MLIRRIAISVFCFFGLISSANADVSTTGQAITMNSIRYNEQTKPIIVRYNATDIVLAYLTSDNYSYNSNDSDLFIEIIRSGKSIYKSRIVRGRNGNVDELGGGYSIAIQGSNIVVMRCSIDYNNGLKYDTVIHTLRYNLSTVGEPSRVTSKCLGSLIGSLGNLLKVDAGSRTILIDNKGTVISTKYIVNPNVKTTVGYVGMAGDGDNLFAYYYDNNQTLLKKIRLNKRTDAYHCTLATSCYDIALLSDGNIAFIWEDDAQDTADTSWQAIKAKVMTKGGIPIKSEFLVNQTYEMSQNRPRLITIPGGFLATWTSENYSSWYDVAVRQYHNNGKPQGDEKFIGKVDWRGVSAVENLAFGGGKFLLYWSGDDISQRDKFDSAILGQYLTVK